ncbi:MAG: vacuolar transporter chaperone [Cirrosporium novae-zelandiae]|nr:MAG: vacuolar transporter chaperone [Cirrosporium novae-zelandiae]
MKFGQQLRTSLIRDYYYYYIAYDDLKDALKKPYKVPSTPGRSSPEREPWTEADEESFVAQLEDELEKVYTFQKVKNGEILRRLRNSGEEVNHVISKLEGQPPRGTGADDAPTVDDFLLLEADLSDIIADVHDLAKFTQLNYTGFQKIIKKHDKLTLWHLKPVFAARLNAKPFFKDNYDATIVELSKLYDLVRTRGNPAQGDSAAGGSQQNFIRQTTKYWVHSDNITELKLIILKHLPVLVFNPSKEFKQEDSAISSIYYDNPETWELYMGRLQKTEGAEAIRLRWYGGMDSEKIFVERKTHREDWTGEKSVKQRFELKEKNVNDFLAGRLTVESVFEKMRKDKKKSEKEIADLEQLAREIQYRVITRKLVPVTRSYYSRTAFQLAGDARVRISLDTELSMIREDDLDGEKRAGDNWRRMDIGVDYPFKQLPSKDIERFPYAILEVKLQTQAGQEPPEWVRDLIGSHLVEAVPKFSKFIHGTATLFPDRINLIPFWMPQMDIDIRKPIVHRFGIERPSQPFSQSTDDLPNNDDSEDDDMDIGRPSLDHPGSSENLRRLREARDAINIRDQERAAEDRYDFSPPGNSLDIEERLETTPLLDGQNDYTLYDSDDEDSSHHSTRISQYTHAISGYLQPASHFLSNLLPAPSPTAIPSRSNIATLNPLANEVSTHRIRAPPGKRIHVPVRVEPKVYLAAERTFLSWLEFSILLGTIAATMLNFGDQTSLYGAIGFTVLAALALAYSMGLYMWRVDKIRKRRAVRYHDRWGPSILCFGLLMAVVATFVFRVREAGWLE